MHLDHYFTTYFVLKTGRVRPCMHFWCVPSRVKSQFFNIFRAEYATLMVISLQIVRLDSMHASRSS